MKARLSVGGVINLGGEDDLKALKKLGPEAALQTLLGAGSNFSVRVKEVEDKVEEPQEEQETSTEPDEE